MEKHAWPEATNKIAGQWPAAGGGTEQPTVIMFSLTFEAGYEQRTSHNVRTPLGALDVYTWQRAISIVPKPAPYLEQCGARVLPTAQSCALPEPPRPSRAWAL